jgi:hypothetical protein
MNFSPPSELEKKALIKALKSFVTDEAQLTIRIERLKVSERLITGFGFFTKFEEESQALDCPFHGIDEKKPPSVSAFHSLVKGNIDFIVWTKDGRIDCLEAASSSSWPQSLDNLALDQMQWAT